MTPLCLFLNGQKRMNNRIYITGTSQISIQEPLCEQWMDSPISYDVKYTRAIDPNFKEFVSPIEARRMGLLLKRAVATSYTVMKESGISQPDAIITGTGLGCIENTELFLNALCFEGENMLKPTYFMQSTHNTIGSLLAIRTKSHGYNVTYAHKGISFDSALYDAYLQMRLNKISNALVGSHDEMTPSYFKLLQKAGYVGGDMEGVCGEVSMAAMLENDSSKALCTLHSMRVLYRPSLQKLEKAVEQVLQEAGITMDDVDGVITGINGNRKNDEAYSRYTEKLFPATAKLRYKHLFGECYSSSSLAFYSAVQCLKHERIPQGMVYGNVQLKDRKPEYLLIFNQQEEKNFSIILLGKQI